MKTVLISGTVKKGSTYHIGKMLVEKLGVKKEDLTEIFLPKDMPEFCIGCTNCFMKDEKLCPHYSYMQGITKAIDDAELLVFTSPVYVFHVTAQLKALLDHYGYRFMVHRPEKSMFKKQAVCIATAAGAGMKYTVKDIKHSLQYWGVARVYTYGVAVRAISWLQVSQKIKEKIEVKVNKIAHTISKRYGRVKPSIKVKAYFYIMRIMQKYGGFNKIDNDYWCSMGWLNKERPWK